MLYKYIDTTCSKARLKKRNKTLALFQKKKTQAKSKI